MSNQPVARKIMSNQPVARLGDTVKITCPFGTHVGIITSGSSHTFSDDKPVARLTDTVVCTTCGGKGQIITGSEYSYAEDLKIARVTDQVTGTCRLCPLAYSGVIIKGSPYKFAS